MFAHLVSGVATLPGWNLSLLAFIAKATIILIAALAITRTMQHASAGARHLVWLVTLGTLMLVPVLAAWAPLRIAILDAPLEAPARVAADRPIDARFEQPTADTDVRRDGSHLTTPAAAPSAIDRLRTRMDEMSGFSIVLAIWAAVVLCIVMSLAWAGYAVRRIVRQARPLESPDWVNPLFEIADRLGLDEAPRLLQSDTMKMPFACGVLRPTIILPAEAEQWTLDRRRAVLLHELAHVRRRDLLGHTLGRLACAVYWFHPLVWTAAKQLRNESERACDDLALSCGTRATDYAEHLLDIVTSVRGDATPLVALAMARRKEFEGRMLAILDPELRRSAPGKKQSAALAGTFVLISLTVAAAAPVRRAAPPDALPTTALVTQSSDTTGRPLPPAVRMRVEKAYPDSGEPGVIDVVLGKSVSTRTAMITSKSTSTHTVASMTHADARSSSSSAAEASAEGRAEPRPNATPDPLASAMVSVRTSSEIALAELAKAGIHVGLNAASSVLSGLGQSLDPRGGRSEKGSKGSKSSDDRPALLAKVLRTDSSASLRRIAAWGLQEYTDSPVAAVALATALRHDSDATVREMAAWALGSGDDGSAASVSALSSALKSDASEKVRATSAWALGNIGEQSAADALTSALADASVEVRTRAAWALGNVEPRQAPKALVALLGDKDSRTRLLAAWALFRIEDPSTAGALQTALKTEQNQELQIAYIRALGAMGEKSVDVLSALLESSDPKVKAMAVRALAGGNAAGPWPWPWPSPRPYP